MSYNGSGTFNINTAGQPVVTGTVISSSTFNALTADLGTGLSTALTKDGQTVATARIPFAQGINSSLVTDATSTTTGSIITAGGVGIAKALYVGTTLNVTGASTLAGITGTFNGTVGATTPSTGAFTTLTTTGTINLLTVGRGGGAVNGNVALGLSAILNASNSGVGLTAIGYEALATNSTGTYNTACGFDALVGNTTGNYNTVLGGNALVSNTTASNNTAVGYQAGYAYTGTTGYNTFFGWQAGVAVTTGSVNTYIGPGSGNAMTSGTKNTILGAYTGNNGGLDIRTASNYIVLSDGDGNPRGIFDSSGNLLVGTTSQPVGTSRAVFSTTGNTQAAIFINDTFNYSSTINWNKATANNNYFVEFATEGTYTARGTITYNRAGGLTVYSTTSDYRLKENIVDLPDALETVSRLKPRQFDWKETGNTTTGFIAHELAEVCPHAVTGEKDATEMRQYEISPAIPATLDEEGNELTAAIEAVMGEREVPRYQGIDTSFLVATLTAAIQEQQAIITALTTRITALEAK